MQMLELRHVLADHEQVIALVVNLFESGHGIAATRMANREGHLERDAVMYRARRGRGVQQVVMGVEGVPEDQRHAALPATTWLR
jgi:hypothetical protein